jgi:hypothetical protein
MKREDDGCHIYRMRSSRESLAGRVQPYHDDSELRSGEVRTERFLNPGDVCNPNTACSLRLQSGCGCGFYSIFLSMDCSCSSPNSCNSVGLQPAEHAICAAFWGGEGETTKQRKKNSEVWRCLFSFSIPFVTR